MKHSVVHHSWYDPETSLQKGKEVIRRQLLDYHVIRIDKPTVEDSVQYGCEVLKAFVGQYQPDRIVIEQPPLTIYGQKFLNKDAMVARAQSVFQTFAAAYGFYGSLYRSHCCRMILPSDWQLSKKQRGGLDTKDWSLKIANEIIEQEADVDIRLKLKTILHTKAEENTADAIVMASRILYQLEQGQLEISFLRR